MQQIRKNRIRPVSKTPAEVDTSLDCRATFSIKLKKVEKASKLRFIACMLLAALFSQNHLPLALLEAIFSLVNKL